MNVFFGKVQGVARVSVCPVASPATADHGLPVRFCQTPLRPLLTLDRFPQPRPQLSRRKRQHRDPPHHTPKEPPRQMALRQQKPVVAGMLHQPSTRLHQPLLQAGQRPVLVLPAAKRPRNSAARVLMPNRVAGSRLYSQALSFLIHSANSTQFLMPVHHDCQSSPLQV